MCFHYLKYYQTLLLLIKKKKCDSIIILLDFIGERILIDTSCSSGFLEASKVRELCCTDNKEQKDTKVNDMEEDVQDLDKDHEVSHTPSDVALNLVLQDS